MPRLVFELGIADPADGLFGSGITTDVAITSPQQTKQRQGQGIYLMYKNDVANLIEEARVERVYAMDTIHLAKTAEIIRRDMFQN